MSAIPTDEPAQDAPPSIDAQQLQQQLQQHQQDVAQLAAQASQQPPQTPQEASRKPKAPSVRRACAACHSGKTRCSEVLPCQSCLKRGMGATCAYPDPEAQHQQQDHNAHQTPGSASQGLSLVFHTSDLSRQAPVSFAPPPMYATIQGAPPNLSHQYYEYTNGTFAASTSTFRPNKRPRNLTEEEAAAITRNFTRGDFFVGSSAPVRIDPRLPVRLTLGEGDHVHFTVGEPLV